MLIVTGIIPSNLFREELKGMSISCFNGKHYYDETAKQALDNIERHEIIDIKRKRQKRVGQCESKRSDTETPAILVGIIKDNPLEGFKNSEVTN